MISRRNMVKLSAVVLIAVIGAVYWYYAERRSSPIEEVEKTVGTETQDANSNLSREPNAASSKAADKTTMKTWPEPTILPEAERKGKEAVIETDKGTIVFEIYPDDAPLAVSNFISLAKGGFYDGLTFHRVVPHFVIQGGDPAGTGTGGPGYNFDIELPKRDYGPGVVAMARTQLPKSNGSQFFIMEPDSRPESLEPLYTILGKVTSGLDVVGKIEVGDRMTKVTVQDKK